MSTEQWIDLAFVAAVCVAVWFGLRWMSGGTDCGGR